MKTIFKKCSVWHVISHPAGSAFPYPGVSPYCGVSGGTWRLWSWSVLSASQAGPASLMDRKSAKSHFHLHGLDNSHGKQQNMRPYRNPTFKHTKSVLWAGWQSLAVPVSIWFSTTSPKSVREWSETKGQELKWEHTAVDDFSWSSRTTSSVWRFLMWR